MPAGLNTPKEEAIHTRGATSIRLALFPEDRDFVLDIWQEYIASPSVSLEYQDYQSEFADLPGKYGPPSGRLLLSEQGAHITGCVALRKIDDAICEMKRLYVRPAARGAGLGKLLVSRLIFEAQKAGYREMRLDVLEEFEDAQRLYAELGFVAAEPVSVNPVPNTLFLGRMLR